MNNVDFHAKNENYNLNNDSNLDLNFDLNSDLERIHFRCPSCSKLYSSDPSQIYVEEPEYTCSKCSAEFSIYLLAALQNTEVVGRLIEKVEEQPVVKAESIELPVKRTEEVKVAVKMSEETGVGSLQQEFDFEALEQGDTSFNDLVQESFKNKFEEKWGETLDLYESRDAHNEFIRFCNKADNIDFAIEKYAKLTEINSNDEIAQSFLKKIQFSAEAGANFEAAERDLFFTKSFYITAGIVLSGILIISLGSLWFQNKNIAGLGIGLIFFTFAARAFFQPRHF